MAEDGSSYLRCQVPDRHRAYPPDPTRPHPLDNSAPGRQVLRPPKLRRQRGHEVQQRQIPEHGHAVTSHSLTLTPRRGSPRQPIQLEPTAAVPSLTRSGQPTSSAQCRRPGPGLPSLPSRSRRAVHRPVRPPRRVCGSRAGQDVAPRVRRVRSASSFSSAPLRRWVGYPRALLQNIRALRMSWTRHTVTPVTRVRWV
jgi:hypothetical protein